MLDIITQEEFNSFRVNELGVKECRTVNYSQIKSFGKLCSFGNGYIAKDLPFIRINNIGSRLDGCIIYNFEKGIYARSGCFFGSVDEFLAKVKKTHAGTVYEKQYTIAVELAKCSF